MNADQLTGYYTYRSFVNRSEPVDDFNKIRFAEGCLRRPTELTETAMTAMTQHCRRNK